MENDARVALADISQSANGFCYVRRFGWCSLIPRPAKGMQSVR